MEDPGLCSKADYLPNHSENLQLASCIFLFAILSFASLLLLTVDIFLAILGAQRKSSSIDTRPSPGSIAGSRH